ncbi:TetR/AcrR family transcriptional regulator [Micromonospora sp. NPDC050187]|uniref:TetR/AcrR family transcriptional regulator n=1 Tax=Micromonospora sp. NPDC050187 TaxID=3364277 RepID=UPI003788D67E
MRRLKTTRQAEVLDAALAVADAQGLGALSMRAVAERMGLTPMALYGYFRSKGELLDALAGRLLTETARPDPTLSWQDQIRALAHNALDIARRHPAVFPLLYSRPAVDPGAVEFVDVLLQALLRAGVRPEQAPRLERMISTFILGFAMSTVSGRFSAGSLDTAARRAQLPSDRLPGHQRLAEHLDAPVDWDAEFDADLDNLITMISTVGAARPAG